MPPKKGSVTKTIAVWLAVFAVIGVLVWAFAFHQGSWPWETPPAPAAPSPADVDLYRFSDLKSVSNRTNGIVNVEIWLKNTGDQTARDVSVFVRVRNQDGTICYTDHPELTWQLLSSGETCSATYAVSYKATDTYLEHTIEIRFSSGMNSALKKTELRP
jgi:hypothetical protein